MSNDYDRIISILRAISNVLKDLFDVDEVYFGKDGRIRCTRIVSIRPTRRRETTINLFGNTQEDVRKLILEKFPEIVEGFKVLDEE